MRALLCLLLAGWASFCLASIEEILAHKFRPEIGEVIQLKMADIEGVLGPVAAPTSQELVVFRFLGDVLAKVRVDYPNHNRVFFGRDLEMLYDLHQITVTPEEKARGFLAPISRLLARDSRTSTVINLLKKTGTNVNEMVRGGQKSLWLDTGARGSIYCNLFGHIYRHLGSSATPEARQNVFGNIDAVLLQSKGNPSMSSYLSTITSGLTCDPGRFFFDYVYYPELDPSLFSPYGVSRDFYSRSRWLVDNIEHTVKWHGRTALVDDAGEITFASHDRYSGDIDRKQHLKLQVKLARFALGNRPWPGDHCAALVDAVPALLAQIPPPVE